MCRLTSVALRTLRVQKSALHRYAADYIGSIAALCALITCLLLCVTAASASERDRPANAEEIEAARDFGRSRGVVAKGHPRESYALTIPLILIPSTYGYVRGTPDGRVRDHRLVLWELAFHDDSGLWILGSFGSAQSEAPESYNIAPGIEVGWRRFGNFQPFLSGGITRVPTNYGSDWLMRARSGVGLSTDNGIGNFGVSLDASLVAYPVVEAGSGLSHVLTGFLIGLSGRIPALGEKYK